MKTHTFLFIFFLFFFICLPRVLSLDAHWNSDEARWLARSSDFMDAIKTRNFTETLIAYHPGVMTMWIAGIRTFYMDFQLDITNLVHARLFIGLVVLIGLIIACLLLNRLFGQSVAITSLVCLAFSPLFLAQTRRVHTDALATIFILLTMLLFLLYCQHRDRPRYLILSGITFGLAVLSKSYALILLPWIPICLFLFFYSDKQKGQFLECFAAVFCFLNCAVLTTIALWPIFWTPIFGLMALCLFGLTFVLIRGIESKRIPLWFMGATILGLILVCVRAAQTVWLVFDKVGWAIATPHEVEHLFLGKVVNDPGWLFYPFVITIKSMPLMLPLAFIGCILIWKQRKDTENTTSEFRITLALVTGAVLFILCLSVTSKKFSRYLLPALLILEILAAIGFIEILKWSYAKLSRSFNIIGTNRYKVILTVIACLCFFSIQVMPVLALHPYYGTYYNLCWKATNITKIITVGDASGMDIAANYLNQKPNARQLVVQVSPLSTHFLRRYFPGRIYGAGRSLAGNPDPNYEVVYIRDLQIGKVPQTGTLNGELEALITLNGIDHVWIYRIPK